MKSEIASIGEVSILLQGIPARTNRGYLGYCTVSLLPISEGYLLFDTGHYGDRHLLMDSLNKMGILPKEVTQVVLSHLHYDHCLNLPLFPKAKVIVANREIKYYQRVLAKKSIDHAIPEGIHSILNEHEILYVDTETKLNDKVKIIPTPGHTPGSLSLQADGDPVVIICGDAVKNAWEFVLEDSDSVYGSESESSESIQRITEIGEVLIPGHDRAFKISEGERLSFLTELKWEISADLYPDKKESKILSLRK